MITYVKGELTEIYVNSIIVIKSKPPINIFTYLITNINYTKSKNYYKYHFSMI